MAVVYGNRYDPELVAGKSEQVWTDPAPIAADPAGCLLESNWLASCGAHFRSDTVGVESFNVESRYLEWTYLAFHLALTRKPFFTTEPTYVINNSPGSLSDSDTHVEAQVAALNRMLKFEMPQALRARLKCMISAASHDLSEHYRRRGVKSAAWKYHFQSLAGINGFLQYGGYTRELLAPSQR